MRTVSTHLQEDPAPHRIKKSALTFTNEMTKPLDDFNLDLYAEQFYLLPLTRSLCAQA